MISLKFLIFVNFLYFWGIMFVHALTALVFEILFLSQIYLYPAILYRCDMRQRNQSASIRFLWSEQKRITTWLLFLSRAFGNRLLGGLVEWGSDNKLGNVNSPLHYGLPHAGAIIYNFKRNSVLAFTKYLTFTLWCQPMGRITGIDT